MRDKTILVVGLARSGCAVGALLRRHGAQVIGVDDAPLAEVERQWRADGLEDIAADAFDEVHAAGDWSFLARSPVTAVALSPGVPRDHERLRELPATVPVLGELEWASRFYRGSVVAITGTNGKSTTTEMIAHLARAVGWQAEAWGNVGRPLSLAADRLEPTTLAVVEVSSFQLETIKRFQPRIGVVLNLAPDHLDRYPDLNAYYAAKRRLAEVVAPGGRFVTWTGCHEARHWRSNAPTLLFGEREAGASVFWEEDHLWAVDDASLPVQAATTVTTLPAGAPQALVTRAEFPVPSATNLINAAAAVAALLPLGPDHAGLVHGLRTFRGLPHRQQQVAVLGGVRFVDDSKATNVAAVSAGLAGYEGDVVLIAGGRGKGEDYTPLRFALGPVRAVVVLGEEGAAIAAALTSLVQVESAPTLDAAVARAVTLAQPRGTVLLSPACASFDMFRNYRERGEAFRAAALALGATEPEVTEESA